MINNDQVAYKNIKYAIYCWKIAVTGNKGQCIEISRCKEVNFVYREINEGEITDKYLKNLQMKNCIIEAK